MFHLINLMGSWAFLERTILGRAVLSMVCFGLFLIQPRKMKGRMLMLLTRTGPRAEEK